MSKQKTRVKSQGKLAGFISSSKYADYLKSTGHSKINHRQAKRKKFKAWKIFAKANGIVGRIKTHLPNDRNTVLWKAFHGAYSQ